MRTLVIAIVVLFYSFQKLNVDLAGLATMRVKDTQALQETE